jgi:hypothetical protein
VTVSLASKRFAPSNNLVKLHSFQKLLVWLRLMSILLLSMTPPMKTMSWMSPLKCALLDRNFNNIPVMIHFLLIALLLISTFRFLLAIWFLWSLLSRSIRRFLLTMLLCPPLPFIEFDYTHRPRENLTLQVKGARFHTDFGFFNVPLVRGFNSFLLIVEAVTLYTWVFLRRNKNPQIALWIWFREYITKTYRVPALAWRTNNGGELWGSSAFRVAVTSQHCVMESTGGYNSASNGKAETRVKACKNTTFSLLYMSGQPRNYWCFVLMHGCGLLNMRPFSDGREPSFEQWTGRSVNISHCRIFGSRTHAVIQRKTRANSNLALRTHSVICLCSQGTPRIVLLQDDNKCLRYAHHVVIDEIQCDLPMDQRSPLVAFCVVKSLPLVLVLISFVKLTPSSSAPIVGCLPTCLKLLCLLSLLPQPSVYVILTFPSWLSCRSSPHLVSSNWEISPGYQWYQRPYHRRSLQLFSVSSRTYTRS